MRCRLIRKKKIEERRNNGREKKIDRGRGRERDKDHMKIEFFMLSDKIVYLNWSVMVMLRVECVLRPPPLPSQCLSPRRRAPFVIPQVHCYLQGDSQPSTLPLQIKSYCVGGGHSDLRMPLSSGESQPHPCLRTRAEGEEAHDAPPPWRLLFC